MKFTATLTLIAFCVSGCASFIESGSRPVISESIVVGRSSSASSPSLPGAGQLEPAFQTQESSGRKQIEAPDLLPGMLRIKDVEGYGLHNDYTGRHIGLADSIVAPIISIGPTQRQTKVSMLQGPMIRLPGATLTPLDAETNEQIYKATKANSEPSMVDAHSWQTIKERYPSMTHVAMTIFHISEEWRIPGNGSTIPYLASSYVIARTIVIDLSTRLTVTEWRQEIQDSSTSARACESPERLLYYLKAVETNPPKNPNPTWSAPPTREETRSSQQQGQEISGFTFRVDVVFIRDKRGLAQQLSDSLLKAGYQAHMTSYAKWADTVRPKLVGDVRAPTIPEHSHTILFRKDVRDRPSAIQSVVSDSLGGIPLEELALDDKGALAIGIGINEAVILLR